LHLFLAVSGVRSAALGWLLTAVVGTAAGAQEIDRRQYLPDRADEDWSFLKDAPREDVWDPLKYVGLARDGWFLTLSGELRLRPEGLRIRPRGDRPGTVDSYLLQRYLFGTDVHFGPALRAFAEAQSGIITGSLRSPRPTDLNRLDLHQAFVEWKPVSRAPGSLAIKVGRQELSVGSTRLISASPGLNVKRSFDGGSLSVRGPTFTVTGAVAQLVRNDGGVFDDRPDPGQRFWGIAAGRRSPRFQRGEVAAYYLGIDRTLSRYPQGTGPEVRHTVGVKWNGSAERLDLSHDALFQWGEFQGGPIRAWAFATETEYRFASRWRPRINARANVTSGDRDAGEPRLESFNPLFPGSSYAGAVGLLGPTNLTDFTPAISVWPRSNLLVGVEAPSYWRTSRADGIYAIDLRVLVLPSAGDGKYVGTNPGVLVVYQATRHLQLQGVVTRFIAGEFLDNTFIAPGFGFYSASAVYRF
jgi:hypothetical protein